MSRARPEGGIDWSEGTEEALAPEFGLTAEQVLASSEFAFGSVDQIVEQLLAPRERHGISYLTVIQPQAEAFAPVVARLAGR